MASLSVVKVGGSLYDLPDLGPRLRRWLLPMDGLRVVLVPGGGAMADAVRSLHRVHGLDEPGAHWLALRALALNAHFLAWLVGGIVAADAGACREAWTAGRVPVLDLYAFACADQDQPGRLPASWDVTSDALAARAAAVLGAGQLVLLKSTTIPQGMSWQEAGRQGYVDPAFRAAVACANSLQVKAINFRAVEG